MEQSSLLNEAALMKSASFQHRTSDYNLPRELPDISSASTISIDLETNDPGIREGLGVGTRRGGYIAGIGVGTPEQQWYFPIRHAVGENMDEAQVLQWAKDTFKNPNQHKLFANALYDLDYLAEAGVKVAGTCYDVQIAEPLIDENRASYSLNSLAKKYLNETKTDQALYNWCAQVYGGKATRKQAGNIWRAPAAIVEPYAHSDCYLPFPIFAKQRAILSDEGLEDVFSLETGIVPLLLAMRQRGVRFDEEKALQVGEYMRAERDAGQAQLDVLAGQHVDIWAAASIAKVFDAVGIQYPFSPISHSPSFTSDWLVSPAAGNIGQLVHDTRRWDKAEGTFIQGLLKYSINGRIHAEFNQLRKDDGGAVSGRFSSSNPNLQNQPSRDPDMLMLIRSLFIPEEGERYVSLDYSQIEFRGLTHYGGGESAQIAQAMFRDDPATDFHTMVAELTGMDRGAAKNVTFALAYGAGINKLASMVGCTREVARRMFDVYHKRLPFLKDLSERANQTASQRGYVHTLMGRRRRFNKWEPKTFDGYRDKAVDYGDAVELWGKHSIKRSKTHTALNAVSQGTAADIAKKAMLDIWRSNICDVVGAPLSVVHDEINFSVPFGPEGDDAIKYISFLMETTVKLKVPLLVGVKEGAHWGECK